MNTTLVVARKEAKELLGSKGTLFLGLGFAVFFPILRSLALVKGYSELEGSTVATSLDGSIFFLSAVLGLIITYISASQIFLLEKRDAVIETLMCAPVNLRQIWLGKVLGIMVGSPDYLRVNSTFPPKVVAAFHAPRQLTTVAWRN
jgi:ABC-2 type transport system permease protein